MRTRNDPFNPKQPEAPLKETPKLLDVLDALQPPNYEILPTAYLHKLFGSYAKPLIATANAYHLIQIPRAREARQLGARNKTTCWELTERGVLLLAKHGRFRKLPWDSDQFSHKYLRSIIQFSFDQAPKEILNLKKRTLANILAHEQCPAAVRQEAERGLNASYIPLSEKHFIKPDAPLFGFEYTLSTGRKRTFYIHGFEADRGTEPLTGYDRQTIEGKIENYTQYLKTAGYKTRYGLANCAIAIITTNATRASSILDVIEKIAKDQARKFIVKTTVPFEANAPVPPPDGHMVFENWMQVGGKMLNILEILKGESDDTRSESRPRYGVGGSEREDRPGA